MLCSSGSQRRKVLEEELDDLGISEDEMGTVRDLREFLLDAELEHYMSAFKNELKVASVPQLKYVTEDDLSSIGMTKPEMRRLKKFYKKECPSGKLEKFKRAIMDKASLNTSGSGRTLSPSPEHRISRPISKIRPTGKQIISSDSIEVKKTLGEGEFGVVQQGLWTTEDGDKVQVAIKCLSRERLENGTQEFLKEAGLMQTIDHENIVQMYGVVLDQENSLMLVTELAPMRSLLECMKDLLVRQEFPLPRLLDFAQQVCDGMVYLESKRLIHRDLAARNILVFDKQKVKISDFGLSRALGRGKDYYQSNFSVNLKLPIAWCAPECINYLKFTSACDMWAFGVTLWEMFTYGDQPWAGKSGQQILDAIDEPRHERLPQPELCPNNYYELMQQCWQAEPETRPTFRDIFIQLPQMRPTQVKAVKDFPEITVPKDYIYYRAYDVIVVIDKSPQDAPTKGLWRGALLNGKIGFFDPCNTVPFIEPISSPSTPNVAKPISRRDSKRSGSKKIRTDMISRPQNDLRHTGHIGYDGAVFGDVGFIGDNYDKLPLKTASISRLDDVSRNSINLSRMSDSPDRDKLSLSDSSINGGPAHKTNGFGRSWISVESLESQTTGRTDERQDHVDPGYQDLDDDSLFADFKMPDISSSFDFGGSFMDEVLNALKEKEAQMEAANNDKTPMASRDNRQEEKGLSLSPPREVNAPPPLPPHPPKAEGPAVVKPEVQKKQAKVKPMSTSDEKLIEDAINKANELVSHNGRAELARQESLGEKQSDHDSGSESPKLLQKLKASIKRSPKHERKRTFSDSLNREMQDEFPPEAQEAYNLLVVHGSVKEPSRGYHGNSEAGKVIDRESLNSSNGSGHNFAYADSSSSSVSRTPDRTSPQKSLSRQSSNRSSTSPPNLGRLPSEGTPDRPTPRPRVEPPVAPRSGIPVPKPRAEILRVEPTPRPPPPPVPTKSAHVMAEAAVAAAAATNSFDNPLEIKEEDEYRSPLSEHDSWNSSERSASAEVLRVDLPDEKSDKLNTSFDSSRKSTSPSEESQSSSSKISFFDEEFSDPSPREIMTKLARESRLRRSLDHQKGSGDGEVSLTRNIREPQGIPAKKPSIPASNDEEEVDTNPLRMLRGGMIPVRGGRGGSGTSSTKPTLRHPKLHFSTPSPLQHSISVDAGRERNSAQLSSSVNSESFESDSVDSETSGAPALPPRSLSICDNYVSNNPLPLPPKNPGRSASFNTKPRERKYPLLVTEKDSNHSLSSKPSGVGSPTSVPYNASFADNIALSHNQIRQDSSKHKSCSEPKIHVVKSVKIHEIKSHSHVNGEVGSSMKNLDRYSKPLPIPSHTADVSKPLHEIDSTSLANLPLAPPPPVINQSDDDELDDNVFEPSTDESVSSCVSKQFNLTSDGGSSGASTFPRGFKMFGLQGVKCNLEQLGFYNNLDPFWVNSVLVKESRKNSARSDPDTSPLMLANYKCTEGVSYEDLLDFALDSKPEIQQKTGEEIDLMQKLFGSDVSRGDCLEALEDTKWDLHKAIKFIKLKQLLSIQLGDVSRCKEALLACDWNVQKAADYMLGKDFEMFDRAPPSPECVDV